MEKIFLTRINTIDVEHLADQHLMAEYRELPMVIASLRRSKASKRGIPSIPEKYTLNSGHVKFFYDKGAWLFKRYYQLIKELERREYDIKPEERTVDWSVYQSDLWNDWCPTEVDKTINCERIILRLGEKTEFYRYNRTKIDHTFIDFLKKEYMNEEV